MTLLRSASSDPKHGRYGHLCSTLCGASLVRQITDDLADVRCPVCGSPIDFEQAGDVRVPVEAAEVVYIITGARGLAHVECYLQDTDCYDLA